MHAFDLWRTVHPLRSGPVGGGTAPVWAFLGLSLLTFAQILMVESILSFHGLGVMPPTPSLGGVAMEAMPHIRTAPHLLWGAVPGVMGLVGLFLVGQALLNASQ